MRQYIPAASALVGDRIYFGDKCPDWRIASIAPCGGKSVSLACNAPGQDLTTFRFRRSTFIKIERTQRATEGQT